MSATPDPSETGLPVEEEEEEEVVAPAPETPHERLTRQISTLDDEIRKTTDPVTSGPLKRVRAMLAEQREKKAYSPYILKKKSLKEDAPDEPPPSRVDVTTDVVEAATEQQEQAGVARNMSDVPSHPLLEMEADDWDEAATYMYQRQFKEPEDDVTKTVELTQEALERMEQAKERREFSAEKGNTAREGRDDASASLATYLVQHLGKAQPGLIPDAKNYWKLKASMREKIEKVIKEAVAGKGDLDLAGLYLTRQSGTLPPEARADIERWTTSSVGPAGPGALGWTTYAPHKAVKALGLRPHEQVREDRLRASTKLAIARQAKEIKEGKKDEVTELNLDVFVWLNNWSMRYMGAEYGSPEEMDEFFGDDYELYLKSRDKTGEYFSGHLTPDREAWLNEEQQGIEIATEEFGRIVDRLHGRAIKVRDLDDLLLTMSQDYRRLAEEGRPEEAAELRERIETLATEMAAYKDQYNAILDNNIDPMEKDLHLRIERYNNIISDLRGSDEELAKKPFIIGLNLENEKNPYTQKLPYFDDAQERASHANYVPYGQPERPLLQFDAPPEYYDALREGFNLLGELNAEDRKRVFGLSGEKLYNAFSKFPGKVRAGDVLNPIGWDETVGGFAIDFEAHRTIIRGLYQVIKERELKEQDPDTPFSAHRVAAEEYAEKTAEKMIQRAMYGQRAPWMRADPEKILEGFMADAEHPFHVAMGDVKAEGSRWRAAGIPIVEGLLGVAAALGSIPARLLFSYDEVLRDEKGEIKEIRYIGDRDTPLSRGVATGVMSMSLPMKRVAGHVYVDGKLRYRYRPGFAQELLGPRGAAIDTFIRILGLGSEPTGAAYQVALNNLQDKILDEPHMVNATQEARVAEVEGRTAQGFNWALLREMAHVMGEPETIRVVTEVTDNVSPMLMMLPEHLIGEDAPWIARNMIRAGIFSGLLLEVNPVDVGVAGVKATRMTRMSQPIRKVSGLRTVDEIIRGQDQIEEILSGHITVPDASFAEQIKQLRVLDDQSLEKLSDELLKLASDGHNTGARVLWVSVMNETALKLGRQISEDATKILEEGFLDAAAFAKEAQKAAKRWDKLIEKAEARGVEDLLETELASEKAGRAQAQYVAELEEYVYLLRRYRKIIEDQAAAIDHTSAGLRSLKELDAKYGLGLDGSRSPVSLILHAVRDVVSAPTGKARILAAKRLGDVLKSDPGVVKLLAKDPDLSLDELTRHVAEVFRAKQIDLDHLVREIQELWPEGPRGRGIPAKELTKDIRKRRRAMRKKLQVVLTDSLEHGVEMMSLKLVERIDSYNKGLAVNVHHLSQLQKNINKFLGNVGKGAARAPADVKGVLQQLIKEARATDLSIEAVRNEKARALKLEVASEALSARSYDFFRESLIDTLTFMNQLKIDPSMLNRVVKTANKGFLVDKSGAAQLGKLDIYDRPIKGVSVPIPAAKWTEIEELGDVQFEHLMNSWFTEGATAAERVDFLRNFMLRGNYVARLFEHPMGRLFKGSKGGLGSYFSTLWGVNSFVGRKAIYLAAIVGGIPLGAAGRAVSAVAGEVAPGVDLPLGILGTKRAYFYYTVAQFRTGGTLYGWRTMFLRELGINSVAMSERLELLAIRHNSNVRSAKDGVNRMVAYVTRRLEEEGASADAIVKAQRAAYRKAMTTNEVFRIEDPGTWAPTLRLPKEILDPITKDPTLVGPVGGSLHEITAFATKRPIIVDAIDQMIFAWRKNDASLVAQKAWGDTNLNTSPAYIGITDAFMPELTEIARGSEFTIETWTAKVADIQSKILDDIIKKWAPNGVSIVHMLDAETVYNDLRNLIIKRINTELADYRPAGRKTVAMTERAAHWEIYHNALMLTASHHRIVEDLALVMGNFTPRMMDSANALLSDNFEHLPAMATAIEVGDFVVPVRKLAIFNEMIGMPIGGTKTKATRAEYPKVTGQRITGKYRRDATMGLRDAPDADIRRLFPVEDAYHKLDGTGALRVDKVINKKGRSPKGEKITTRYLVLENGEEVLDSAYTRQGDHYALSFLDGLEGMFMWGFRNVDRVLDEADTTQFLTMRRKIDKMTQRFIIHSYNPKNPANPIMIPENALTHFNDVIERTRKLLHAAGDTNPTVNRYMATWDHGLQLFKSWMLTGYIGVGRYAMVGVQAWGDVTNMWMTGQKVPTIYKAGLAGGIGYLGPRWAKGWDDFALRLEKAAEGSGQTWLPPMVAAMTNPLLAKVLTRNPEVIIKLPGDRFIDARTLARWMDEDVGLSSIASEGSRKMMDRTARRMAKTMSPEEADVFDRMAEFASNQMTGQFGGTADRILWASKRSIQHSVETGTLRTRQAVWLDTLVRTGSRDLARKNLNYSLMDWTSATTRFDLEIMSKMVIFTTFVKEMYRQGFMTMFDAPSTSLGQYMRRYMGMKTGFQRQTAFIKLNRYATNAALGPHPGQYITEEEAAEYGLRAYYPGFNYDRFLVDFGALTPVQDEIFKDAKMARTHYYAVMPGVQALFFWKTITSIADLLASMIFIDGDEFAHTDLIAQTDTLMDILDSHNWDHVMWILGLLAAHRTGEQRYKSQYGKKLTEGEAEALMQLGQWQSLIPFEDILLTDKQGHMRLNMATKEGVPTNSSSMAWALAMMMQSTMMLKSWDRIKETWSLADPDSEFAPAAIKAWYAREKEEVYAAAIARGEDPDEAEVEATAAAHWAARWETIKIFSGIAQQRTLHLGNSQHFSIYQAKKRMTAIETILKTKAEELEEVTKSWQERREEISE